MGTKLNQKSKWLLLWATSVGVVALAMILSHISSYLADWSFINSDPDFGASFEQIVLRHSDIFELQTHHVVTDDGYIVGIYRIRFRNTTAGETIPKPGLKPVIQLYGLFLTPESTVIGSPHLFNEKQTPGDTLSYALALTKRYDVWIPKLRGSGSKQHRTLKSNQVAFWKFSFEQIALYDVSAVVDYVIQHTNRSTVGVVGGSLGATHSLVLLSLRPEYADKIRPVISVAPVVFISHRHQPFYDFLALFIGYNCLYDGEAFWNGPIIQFFTTFLCNYDKYLICPIIFKGGNHVNLTRLPVYMSHFPGSTSNHNACHLRQWFYSDRFPRYDYGTEQKNRDHYGQATAPDYPLHKIPRHAKIALITSVADSNGKPAEVERLRTMLTKQAGVKLVKDVVIRNGDWEHMDLMFGVGVGKKVNRHIIDIFDRHLQ